MSEMAKRIIEEVCHMAGGKLPTDSEGINELMGEAEKAVDDLLKRPDLIEKTKNFPRIKISVRGAFRNGGRGDRASLKMVEQVYFQGKDAWLRGDFEEVADMFGILI